jgi:hypothetical protein
MPGVFQAFAFLVKRLLSRFFDFSYYLYVITAEAFTGNADQNCKQESPF